MNGKLVRDKIPKIIANETGVEPSTDTLCGMELITALKKKIIEEGTELAEAQTRAQVREELGDVSEAFDALLEALHISPQELEVIKSKKRELKGGFKKGVFLHG